MSEARAGHLPYTGTPEVTPRFAPAEFQRIPTSPREFGAQIGAGLETVGRGLQKTSDVYSDIAAQQATTNWSDGVDRILFGDPSKPGDVGYYGLHGQAAMDARAGVTQQIEDLTQHTLSGLGDAKAQIQFQTESRRYRMLVEGEIGRHYDQESKTWGVTVNNDQYQNALATAALRPADEQTSALALARANEARIRSLQVQGLLPMDVSKATPEQLGVVQRETRQASVDVLEARIHAMVPRDPAAANVLFKQNENLLSTSKNYDALSGLLKHHASMANGNQMLMQAEGAAGGHPAPGAQAVVTPGEVAQAAQKNGVDPALANATADIESAHGANLGERGNVFQLGPTERASVGVFGFGSPSEQIDYGTRFLAEKQKEMALGLGRTPTNAEVYLAHQQGTTGALDLLTKPTARAGDVVGDKAIRANGGDPNETALDYVQAVKARYEQAQAKYAGITVAPGATPSPSPMPQMQDLANAEAENSQRYARVLTNLNNNPAAADDPDAYRFALSKAEAGFRARQLALTAGKTALTEQRAAAMDEYTKAMISGPPDPQMIGKIAADPRLDAETRQNLMRFYDQHMQSKVDGDTAKYGPQFFTALQRLTAPDTDPNRVRDPTQLLKWTVPDADGQQGLTVAGYQKLTEMMKSAKTPEGVGGAKMLDGALAYAKRQLSFEQDFGMGGKIPDPAGLDRFNEGFTQSFFDYYDKGIAAGKTPQELLAKDKLDPLIAQFMRTPAQTMRDMMSENADLKPPPGMPQGVPGLPYGAVWLLRQHPEWRDRFDEQFGAGAADKVLGARQPPPGVAPPIVLAPRAEAVPQP